MMHPKTKALAKNNKYNNEFCFKQLQELEQEIDWDDLVEAIFPHYVKSKLEPILVTVESMLRINILGRYFDMSPASVKKALFQTKMLRQFALIDLDHDVMPNSSCIADFNSVLIEKSLVLKIEQALSMQPIKTECSASF